MPNHHIIRLHNAVFYAYHGVVQDEQNLGGKFEIDVDLYTDFTEAAEHDSLKQTVDYEKVYNLVKRVVTEKKYYLIEALANKIAKSILEAFERVDKVCVCVRKPSAPVKGVIDYVEAELMEERIRK
jgi:dihydroneopterin aldolase